MKKVTQTRGYVSDDSRGNCLAACFASIFELPLSAVPRNDDQKVYKWLKRRYPGVSLVRKHYTERHPEYPYEWLNVGYDEPPNSYHGLWIATVESPRFTTTCTRCGGAKKIEVLLKEDGHLPHDERERATVSCVVCEGTGHEPGLHAVVMRGYELAWDPSPEREMGFGRYRGETTFIVTDPSLLARR